MMRRRGPLQYDADCICMHVCVCGVRSRSRPGGKQRASVHSQRPKARLRGKTRARWGHKTRPQEHGNRVARRP